MSSPDAPVPVFTRRVLLSGSAQLALAALVACGDSARAPSLPGGGPIGGGTPTPPVLPTTPKRFLSDAEHAALEAFVDRLIPADADPGALAGGCADAIDYLLGAFLTDPPFIYAGGPFSDRAGHGQNQFASFLPLDGYEAFAWRLALEGSQGKPEREFNGAVKGLQAIYREGLAQLDARAQGMGSANFAALGAPQRDVLINDSSDALIAELVDVAFPATLNAFYGAPEYGGNRDGVGWGFTAYEGDVQPRGYTDAQVVEPDNPSPLDALLPPSYHDPAQRSATPLMQRLLPQPTRADWPLPPQKATLAAAPPFESMGAMVQAADGRLSRLRVLMGVRNA
ncbi:MAG: gluconate 2-dehydrogenase subunit 3 family protein [Pseudomonadota bacterium]